MKLKNILLACTVLYTIYLCKAQNNQYSPRTYNNFKSSGDSIQAAKKFKDKLTYNIGGGLWFGSYTNVNLLPQIGYKITDNWVAGIGANFQYYKNYNFYPTPLLVYGGNVFTRFRLTQNLFTQAEYQVLQYNNTLGDYAMIGGGYTTQDGFYISAYYLLKYPKNNAYGAPYFVRLGFQF